MDFCKYFGDMKLLSRLAIRKLIVGPFTIHSLDSIDDPDERCARILLARMFAAIGGKVSGCKFNQDFGILIKSLLLLLFYKEADATQNS